MLLHLTKTRFPLMLGVNVLLVQYKLCQHTAVQTLCHRHYYPVSVQSDVQLAYLPFTNNVDLRWPCSSELRLTSYVVIFHFTFKVLNIMAILRFLKQATPHTSTCTHVMLLTECLAKRRVTTHHTTQDGKDHVDDRVLRTRPTGQL